MTDNDGDKGPESIEGGRSETPHSGARRSVAQYDEMQYFDALDDEARRDDALHDEALTRTILWYSALTALLTVLVTIGALYLFGLLSLSGSVNLRGNGHSTANVQKLQQIWDSLNRDYYEPVDEGRMIDYAASGMAASLGDVYTTYYTKEEMRQFTEHAAGVYYGIGIYVTLGDNGRLRVTGFLENSPAYEAGMLRGDEIMMVNGADVSGITDTNRVIDLIKGEAGEKVNITLYRPSEEKMLELAIERREIKAENVFSRLIYFKNGEITAVKDLMASARAVDTAAQSAPPAEGATGVGTPAQSVPTAVDAPAVDAPAEGAPHEGAPTEQAPGSGMPIGYIYLTMFDGSAYEYFERHLNALLANDISALVIDVRGNPGGDYDQTVRIADRLIGKGVIVYTEDRAGKREYRESDEASLGLPIRVLVNGDSASASEILAGAVKDSGAGLLVGTKTFGKGLVQAVLPLKDGSGLKYTRSRYYTPSGVCIQGDGIEPDIYIELAPQYYEAEVGDLPQSYDTQLRAALSDIEKNVDKALYG